MSYGPEQCRNLIFRWIVNFHKITKSLFSLVGLPRVDQGDDRVVVRVESEPSVRVIGNEYQVWGGGIITPEDVQAESVGPCPRTLLGQ